MSTERQWMVRADKWRGALWGLGFVLTLGFGAGCGDDLYASCELDANSEDNFVRQCAQGEDQRSCAVESYLQCDTRICGRFEGSSAFCTIACQSDADCPGGQCREFVLQSGRSYCVRNEDIAN